MRASSIVISVLLVVAGILAVAIPFIAGVAVTAVTGWLLIFGGLFHVAFAWRARTAGAVSWQILLGIVYGAIGIYLIARPLVGLASLTLALGIYLFVEAVLEFVLFFEHRVTGQRGWLLFDAIVTLALALMIWTTWPSSASWVLGTLVGLSILFSGIARLMMSTAHLSSV